MHKSRYLSVLFLITLTIYSCSKKNHPAGSASAEVKKNETKQEKNAAVKPKPTEVLPVPQVLLVNDKFARKTPDGRYYYDLRGHRYWRNNKDGKYYLFNKSMYTDDAYKKSD